MTTTEVIRLEDDRPAAVFAAAVLEWAANAAPGDRVTVASDRAGVEVARETLTVTLWPVTESGAHWMRGSSDRAMGRGARARVADRAELSHAAHVIVDRARRLERVYS